MRICRLSLEGYGRFLGRDLDLSAGLQVIVGPNEQGKSTIRQFIGDMLYGQKSSTMQRRYDDTHDLRRPWASADCYGGRMVYRLDDGRELEVERNFDRRRESVRVFDRTNGQDITTSFPVLPNREPLFAEAHLKLSKAVFLNTATICHLSLELLGDEEALTQIREKILSLADAAEEGASADGALNRLEDRIGAIGRPAPGSKRPLPAARAALAELEREYAEAVAARRDAAEREARRRAVREEAAALRRRRAELDEELRAIEQADRANRLREAERLAGLIQEATRRCFSLSALRDFPLEQEHDVQRAANVAATARAQLERTRSEHAALQQQLDEELSGLGPAAARPFDEIPEEVEERLAKIELKTQQFRQRLEELAEERTNAEGRLRAAQQDLASLPDFSRLGADPVEWLSQLASSFRAARQSRDEEREKRAALRADVERRRRELAEPERLFGQFRDFTAEAREYEVGERLFEERWAQGRTEAERLHGVAEEHEQHLPGARAMTGLFAVVLAVLVGVAHTVILGAYVAVAFAGVGLAYFAGVWIAAYVGSKRARAQLADLNEELRRLEEAHDAQRQAMEQRIREAGCETIRELEAMYDRYCAGRAELAARAQQAEQQERRTALEEEQVARLFERIRQTYRDVGVAVEDEADVQDAAGKAIALYQKYRDTKRRITENRDVPSSLDALWKQAHADLEAFRKEEVALSLEVRRRMRENGFAEERKYTSALNALRAYRTWSAQLRQRRGRVEVLQEKRDALTRQLEAEERDLARHEAAFAAYLERAGASSMEEWRELSEQARSYREAWAQRQSLEQQLDGVLRGESIEALREAVEAAGPVSEGPLRSVEEVRREAAAVSESLDACVKEEHAAELAIAARWAGLRPISEIEEDRAMLMRRIAELSLEMEAAVYAATVIEEAARDKHARIAPKLATLAGQYLSEITGGAYRELYISRDLRISVRTPQTMQINEHPERLLSKGTVDQIYLALRLALVQSLSASDESVPMLLDDPFANYDYDRLRRALMLLARLSERMQILLFTCRDDVAEAARALGAPILTL